MSQEISGIYEIKCFANGKRYIGSSKNIKSRWATHRATLESGQHYNKHLQYCWNKYGKRRFQFSILEECVSKQLLEREQFYLDNAKDSQLLNGSIIARCPESTLKIRQQRSERARIQHAKGRLGQATWNEDVKRKVAKKLSESWTPERRAALSKWAKKLNQTMWTPERRARVAEAMRKRRVREKEEGAPPPVRSEAAKALWTPERRTAQAERMRRQHKEGQFNRSRPT